jgi:hypothetical protein
MEETNYLSAVGELKKAILKSRITAATLVNKELLVLYFFIGKYVSANTRNKNWGNGGIDKISNLLQQELNGLRGFSATNIKNMRIFFEEWQFLEPLFFQHSMVELFDNQESTIRQLVTDELEIANRQMPSDELEITIRQLPTDDLENKFFRVGFSHHTTIINKIKTFEDRLFYIEKCVSE